MLLRNVFPFTECVGKVRQHLKALEYERNKKKIPASSFFPACSCFRQSVILILSGTHTTFNKRMKLIGNQNKYELDTR